MKILKNVDSECDARTEYKINFNFCTNINYKSNELYL